MTGHQDTCAVIQARNAETSIKHVLSQLTRSGIGCCVVVVNGCNDSTASVTASALKSFSGQGSVVSFSESLGHDVGKAVGTYYALRSQSINVRWFVYVDGDWKGGFGPDLERFITSAKQSKSDVFFVSGRTHSAASERIHIRTDLQLWRAALDAIRPELSEISISESPIVVRRSVFTSIAPYWLYHPGLWSARCLLQEPDLRLGVSGQWLQEFTGNPARTGKHQQKMMETLIGDALEGIALLKGQQPQRWWKGKDWVGYHADRRTDLLQDYMATLTASL